MLASPSISGSAAAHCSVGRADGPRGGFLPAKAQATPVVTPSTPRHRTPKVTAAIATYTISGTVTGAGGTPLENIYVEAGGANNWSDAVTGPGGTYSISVTPDTYVIAFTDWEMAHANGFYGSGGFTLLPSNATPIVIAAASVGGINAQLPTAYPVTGTVTAAGSIPLENILVIVSSSSYSAYAQTPADGTYVVGVPSGTYTVRFSDQTNVYATGYWSTGGFTKDLTSASPLVVTTAARPGISTTMPKNPRITGRVTASGGVPLANIAVMANDADNGSQASNATTAADGRYALPVPAGSYQVQFDDPTSTYAGGYYSTAGYTADSNSSSLVTVGAGDVAGIDVTLPKAIHLKGRLSGLGGVAAAGMNINVSGTNGGSGGQSQADGTYSIAVTPGIYSLQVRDGNDPPVYATGYAGAGGSFTLDPGAAAPFIVTTADVTANLQLPKLVHVKGRVTKAGGAGIAGIDVWASGGQYSTTSGADGTYSLPVPANGNWAVQFYDRTGGYTSGFYRSTGFTVDPYSAGSIAVGSVDVSGYNVLLPANRHISGKVTKAGGVGLAGIMVSANSLTYSSSIQTAADGSYSVGVPAGSYTLSFNSDSDLYSAGYLGASGYSFNTSKTIVVSTANVTAANVQLPTPAAVTGTVATTAGVGVAGIEVTAVSGLYTLDSSTWASIHRDTATTGADGKYTLHVPPGGYIVSFGDPTDVRTSAYYAGASVTLDRNQAVRVAVGTTAVSGVNGRLGTNRHITGRLTGPGGVGLSGAFVSVSSTLWATYAVTGSDGSWSVHVPAGSYGVLYQSYESLSSRSIRYGWFSTTGLKPTADAASAVTVTTADVTRIDAQVASTTIRSISGVVTGAGASALPGIEVCASSALVSSCAATSATGAYSVGVPAGVYTVSFLTQSWAGGAPSAFSDGYWSTTGTKTSIGQASPVTVSTSNRSGVNAVLPRSLHISGRVTGPNGVGVATANVYALSSTLEVRAQSAVDGRYTISLPPGSYKLEFDTIFADGSFAWGWYGASGFTTSSPAVVAVATANVSGINVKFPRPVWLAGRITRSGGFGMGGVDMQAASSPNYGVSAWTRDDGQWSTLAPAGTFKVSIHDDVAQGYSALRLPNGWYSTSGFTLAAASASSVVVSTTNRTGINATVPLGRRISGFATGANKLPLSDLTATASATGYSVATSTDSSGAWVVPVPAGSFRIHFVDPGGTHLSGYYSSTGFTTSSAAATSVVVSTADIAGRNVAIPLDKTAPTATAPVVSGRVGVAISGSNLPVTVSWTGADNAGGGIARYALEKSTNGGSTWTTLSSTITTTSYATTVVASGTVRFAVRPTDRAGNVGSWVLGPVLTPVLAQTSTHVTYGGTWGTASSASYSGGSTRYSSAAKASATYTFTGRSIALVMTKAASRGAVRIYVDGSASYTTVNCYRSGTMYRAVVWAKRWTSSGSHKVKVVVVGTSGRPRVDFDAIIVIK